MVRINKYTTFGRATIPVRPSIAIEQFIEFLHSSAASITARD